MYIFCRNVCDEGKIIGPERLMVSVLSRADATVLRIHDVK